MIEFLLPVVSAHVLFDSWNNGDPNDLFYKTKDVLQQTSRNDVRSLIEMKKLANRMSHVENKYPVQEHDVSTVFDYYKKELEIERGRNNLNGIVHNRQFVEGYPDIRLVFDTFEKSKHDKFADRVVEAYNQLYTVPGYENLGHGIAADFTAVALYLALAYSHGKEIIK